MDQQQLVIVTLSEREPVESGTVRYLLSEDDRPGQNVIMLEPVTPDDLQANDPGIAYGTVRVITDRGVEVVQTVGLGVLVIRA